VLAYDYYYAFEAMDLACDEAFDLAEEIANRFLKWLEENDDMVYSDYEILRKYCGETSFEEVWEQMHKK
jgi:hypothetical protein